MKGVEVEWLAGRALSLSAALVLVGRRGLRAALRWVRAIIN